MADKRLLARPFDLRALTVSSTPAVLATSVGTFAASETGILAYFDDDSAKELIWISRAGKHLGGVGATQSYQSLRLSPDGSRLAYAIAYDNDSEKSGLWVHDLARGGDIRLSAEVDGSPVWSPDGTQLAFDRLQGSIGIRSSTGAGEQIAVRRGWVWPSDWSRDGRYLAYRYR